MYNDMNNEKQKYFVTLLASCSLIYPYYSSIPKQLPFLVN